MIHSLPAGVRESVRSGVAVSSVCQCVEELVLNSLDAGAGCVAVRADFQTRKVQVVDNGSGISRQDLRNLGQRYMTSKCSSLDDLKRLVFHAYRGEALASIADVSGVLEIQTRKVATCTKRIKGNESEIELCKNRRASVGTTVTVYGLFDRFPVRKKSIKPALEKERIISLLRSFSLAYFQVTFSFRDDTTGDVLFQSKRHSTITSAFRTLFSCQVDGDMHEVSVQKDAINVHCYVNHSGHSDKSLQFVYVNHRRILKSLVHDTMNEMLKRSSKFRKLNKEMAPTSRVRVQYPVFIVLIRLPYLDYDITFDPAKTFVQFHDWKTVNVCLKKAVDRFLAAERLDEVNSSDSESENGDKSGEKSDSLLPEPQEIRLDEIHESLFSKPAVRTKAGSSASSERKESSSSEVTILAPDSSAGIKETSISASGENSETKSFPTDENTPKATLKNEADFKWETDARNSYPIISESPDVCAKSTMDLLWKTPLEELSVLEPVSICCQTDESGKSCGKRVGKTPNETHSDQKEMENGFLKNLYTGSVDDSTIIEKAKIVQDRREAESSRMQNSLLKRKAELLEIFSPANVQVDSVQKPNESQTRSKKIIQKSGDSIPASLLTAEVFPSETSVPESLRYSEIISSESAIPHDLCVDDTKPKSKCNSDYLIGFRSGSRCKNKTPSKESLEKLSRSKSYAGHTTRNRRKSTEIHPCQTFPSTHAEAADFKLSKSHVLKDLESGVSASRRSSNRLRRKVRTTERRNPAPEIRGKRYPTRGLAGTSRESVKKSSGSSVVELDGPGTSGSKSVSKTVGKCFSKRNEKTETVWFSGKCGKKSRRLSGVDTRLEESETVAKKPCRVVRKRRVNTGFDAPKENTDAKLNPTTKERIVEWLYTAERPRDDDDKNRRHEAESSGYRRRRSRSNDRVISSESILDRKSSHEPRDNLAGKRPNDHVDGKSLTTIETKTDKNSVREKLSKLQSKVRKICTDLTKTPVHGESSESSRTPEDQQVEVLTCLAPVAGKKSSYHRRLARRRRREKNEKVIKGASGGEHGSRGQGPPRDAVVTALTECGDAKIAHLVEIRDREGGEKRGIKSTEYLRNRRPLRGIPNVPAHGRVDPENALNEPTYPDSKTLEPSGTSRPPMTSDLIKKTEVEKQFKLPKEAAPKSAKKARKRSMSTARTDQISAMTRVICQDSTNDSTSLQTPTKRRKLETGTAVQSPYFKTPGSNNLEVSTQESPYFAKRGTSVLVTDTPKRVARSEVTVNVTTPKFRVPGSCFRIPETPFTEIKKLNFQRTGIASECEMRTRGAVLKSAEIRAKSRAAMYFNKKVTSTVSTEERSEAVVSERVDERSTAYLNDSFEVNFQPLEQCSPELNPFASEESGFEIRYQTPLLRARNLPNQMTLIPDPSSLTKPISDTRPVFETQPFTPVIRGDGSDIIAWTPLPDDIQPMRNGGNRSEQIDTATLPETLNPSTLIVKSLEQISQTETLSPEFAPEPKGANFPTQSAQKEPSPLEPDSTDSLSTKVDGESVSDVGTNRYASARKRWLSRWNEEISEELAEELADVSGANFRQRTIGEKFDERPEEKSRNVSLNEPKWNWTSCDDALEPRVTQVIETDLDLSSGSVSQVPEVSSESRISVVSEPVICREVEPRRNPIDQPSYAESGQVTRHPGQIGSYATRTESGALEFAQKLDGEGESGNDFRIRESDSKPGCENRDIAQMNTNLEIRNENSAIENLDCSLSVPGIEPHTTWSGFEISWSDLDLLEKAQRIENGIESENESDKENQPPRIQIVPLPNTTEVVICGQNWLVVTDSCGRDVYIDPQTGNSTFMKPLTPDRGILDSNRDQTFSHHPVLSHATLKMQPRTKSERVLKLCNESEVEKIRNSKRRSMDKELEVKWRLVTKEGVENIKDAFANWQNPVFQRSKDVLNIGVDPDSAEIRYHRKETKTHTFIKEDFENLEVLNQVDEKFIACVLNTVSNGKRLKFLVLIDQHAAHERVRLEVFTENLMLPNGNLRSAKIEKMTFSFPATDLDLLKSYQRKIQTKFGLEFEIRENEIVVTQVPYCFVNSDRKFAPDEKQISCFVEEVVRVCRECRGALGALPQTVQELLWSQACHGAIKFGDKLTLRECGDLIISLGTCRLPFQCAHGRPSLVPLLDMFELEEKLPRAKITPNLKILSDLMRKVANN